MNFATILKSDRVHIFLLLYFCFLVTPIVVINAQGGAGCGNLTTQEEVDNATSLNGCWNISGPGITNLDAFNDIFPLFTTGNLYIYNNPLLTDISGLQGLTVWNTCNHIHLINNPLITEVSDSFKVYHATIRNNASLEKANWIQPSTASQIRIEDNPSLKDLPFLTKPTLNSLVVKNNDVLTHLDSVGSLITVYDSLVIEGNADLVDIDSLGNITSVANFVAMDNPRLSRFCGLSDLYFNNAPSSTVISGNLSNPTPREIQGEGACAPFKIGQTGYESLTAALVNSVEHDYIYLTDNYTIDTPITFPDSNEVTLLIEPNVTLTLDGEDFINEGIIVNHGTMDFINGAELTTRFAVVNTGTINLD